MMPARGRTRPRNLGMPMRGDPMNGVGSFRGFLQGSTEGGPQPGMGGGRQRSAQSPSIFDQFNAWQDPNIGGQQPGPIQPGYGGFGALDTMGQTKMNGFLNTLDTGGPREQAMNQLGYFNGGKPFTPQRFNPSQSMAAPDSGSATYQTMSPGGRGYQGTTTVDPSGAMTQNPFDRNPRGGGRLRRRGGTTGGMIY